MGEPDREVAERAVEELLRRLEKLDGWSCSPRIYRGVMLHPQEHPPRVLLLEGDVAEEEGFERLRGLLGDEAGWCGESVYGVVIFEGFEGPKESEDGSVGVVLQFYLVRLGLRVRAWMSLKKKEGEDGGES